IEHRDLVPAVIAHDSRFVVLVDGRRGHLTAPCSSAVTKLRWKITKISSDGRTIRRDPAQSRTMSVPYWPWNAPRPPATVRLLGSSTRTSGSRYWFQVARKNSTASVDHAGVASGRWTQRKVCQV